MTDRLHPFSAALVTIATLLAVSTCSNARQTAQQPLQTGASSAPAARPRLGVPGIPYSADESVETTRVLADGTKITRKELQRVYRDGEGRERKERFSSHIDSSEASSQTPESVTIWDFVAGVRYVLDPRHQTARENDLQPYAPPDPQTSGTSGSAGAATKANSSRIQTTREALGEREIEGFATEGERTTATTPAGAAGNDRPIQHVAEMWYSRELRAAILTTQHDPRMGDTVRRLTNIQLGEPPADLFQVPLDYTVIQEPPRQ